MAELTDGTAELRVLVTTALGALRSRMPSFRFHRAG